MNSDLSDLRLRLDSTIASPISVRSRNIIFNAHSAEYGWASWFSELRPIDLYSVEAVGLTRQCNFQRFSSLAIHRSITSWHEKKATKFGKDNYAMQRMGRKREGRTRSSLIRGGRKTTAVAPWRLIEPYLTPDP